VRPLPPQRPHAEAPRRAAQFLFLTLTGAAFLYEAMLRPWRHLLAFEGDFGNHYLAATVLRQGISPYSIHAFDYPPLPALLVAPLSLIAYDSARQAWLILGQACLVTTAWVVWKMLAGEKQGLLVAAGAFGVAGTLAVNLVLGQIHPLMLLLLAGAFATMATRPALAGALIGGAAALKLWPGLLLLALAMTRRWRGLLAGAMAAALLILGPLLLLALAWPPPHLPTSAGYWMGSPAPLNASWPAVALRLLERPVAGESLPITWLQGDNPDDLTLPAAHRALSVVVALAVLGVGGALLLRSYGSGTAPEWHGLPGLPSSRAELERDHLLLGATISLTLLAAPISWYHYQIFQLLPASVLGLRWLRRRAFLPLALLAALLGAVTRVPGWSFGAYVGRYGWEAGSPALLWLSTTSGPLLGTALFSLLLVELYHSRPDRRARPA
jgi:hypothetical protein